MVHPGPRFVGVKLSDLDRSKLRLMQTRGAQMSARDWRRIRTLLLLDKGLTVTAVAAAVGSYRRETARVGRRYLQRGLDYALSDDPRPKPAPLLDSTQQAAIVAMVCGPPPEGRARWTVRLVAEHAVQRGIASRIGRETARVALADHGLKPWREKNVVRAGDRRRIHRPDGGRARGVRAST